MKRSILLLGLLFLILLIAACNPPAVPTPTPVPPTATPVPPTPTAVPTPPVATGVVISEVLGGIEGNNNQEFIELYNPTELLVDLKGWTLWYRLKTGDDAILIHRWRTSALVPPHGHSLLGRENQDLGIIPDATFNQALNIFNGGLELRQADGTAIDRLGWGEKAPAAFSETAPAPPLANGQSLQRLPGGDEGNSIDSDDNSADFILNPDPAPQNSGSPVTPPDSRQLQINLEAPAHTEPGSSFAYTLTVSNATGQDVHGVIVDFPLPAKLLVAELPDGIQINDAGLMQWLIASLPDAGSQSITIPVIAPWTYLTARAQNTLVRADDWPQVSVGGPVLTDISGGVIPIATARTLVGAEIDIKGVATMYTGGFYAGGGNTKFYLRDDTGGIQVQVFGGEGSVNISVGARVQVHGVIGVYRGAAQIVPNIVPDDIEILAPPDIAQLPVPLPVSIQQAATDMETLPGRLVQVAGTATRAEEFTYSYEIDLVDDQSNLLTLYVDKQTNLSIETIVPGKQYSAIGILEVRDGHVKLYPRFQTDLAEVFPPELLLTADAPLNVVPGDIITYTAIIANYTAEPMSNVRISAGLPSQAMEIIGISAGGKHNDGAVVWNRATLAGNGETVRVWYSVRAANAASGAISSSGFAATADQWLQPAQSSPLHTFLGNSVPIWAVQGPGDRSPVVQKWLTIDGVVTDVTPELGGFFVQETQPDDDPATSEGIFINTAGLDIAVSAGNWVEVTGQVRETSQQTQLMVVNPTDVGVLEAQVDLPPAVELDPPATTAAAIPYFEALEGMLVQVTGPAWATSPTSKYGEYVVVLPEHGQKRLFRGQDNGFAIMVDDGSSTTHTDRSTLPYVVMTGDEVSHLLGPLAYTYGHYKIEPIAPPVVQSHIVNVPGLPLTRADEFSIMTWNVENLFDNRDPNPNDPPKPTKAEYELALDKVANTIVAAGLPTLIALQEVENIDVLNAIAARPALADTPYQAYLIEGHDSRGIDVGTLVRSDRVKVLDTQQFDAPEGLTSRPPLLLQVQITGGAEPVTVFLLNNHFSSMSGGVAATEPRRTAQAAWNVQVMQEHILGDDPKAKVAILGDLNSFYDSLPIDTLRQAGLHHVMEVLSPEERYDYIYQGESQVLDHIMVTPSLFEMLKRVDILHVNADFPPAIPDDPSPLRKSDHDPVLATFSLP